MSVRSRKQCVKCDKGGGIFTCDGCQQSFCVKHVNEHRQDLGVELDHIVQEHDSLQYGIMGLSFGQSLVEEIDQWEKEAIAKIQITAENTRANLRTILNQSKERLLKVCHGVTVDICSSREADNFSEDDLIRWKEQLKEVQLQTQPTSLLEFIEDRRSIIPLIKMISDESLLPLDLRKREHEERFIGGVGSAIIEDGGHLVRHIGPTGNYAYIFGNRHYSSGQHTVRLEIEKCHLPYRIFLGCTSSQWLFKQIDFLSPDIVGWFGSNQVYENGRCSSNCKEYNYNSFLIKESDIMHLTFDCDRKQIKLFNDFLDRTSKLSVDTNKLPYPWRLVVVLVEENDCVRILTDI